MKEESNTLRKFRGSVAEAPEDECLVVLERLPGAVIFHGFLDGIREVGEEVQASTALDFIHADSVIGIRDVVIWLVLEPKSDGAGLSHLSSASGHLQENLPVVLRNRARPVRITLVSYPSRFCRVGDVFPIEQRAGCDIERIRLASLRTHGCLQLRPDATVEIVLDLGRAVDAVVRLLDHVLVVLTVRIRNLVTTAVVFLTGTRCVFYIVCFTIQHVVASAPNVNLVAVAIIGPKAVSGGRAPRAAVLVRTGIGTRVEWIGHPHGREHGPIVQVCVIALGVAVPVRSSHQTCPGGGAGQLKPPRSVTGVICGVSTPGGSAPGFTSFTCKLSFGELQELIILSICNSDVINNLIVAVTPICTVGPVHSDNTVGYKGRCQG